MQDLKPTPKRRSVLEEFKNRLTQSTESWKTRVQIDPDLKKLGAVSRTRKQLFQEENLTTPVASTSETDHAIPKSVCGSAAKGISRLHTSSSSISPPSKIVHLSTSESVEIDSSLRLRKSVSEESETSEVLKSSLDIPSSSVDLGIHVFNLDKNQLLVSETSVLPTNKENETFLECKTSSRVSERLSFVKVSEEEGQASTSTESIPKLDSGYNKSYLQKSLETPEDLKVFFEAKHEEVGSVLISTLDLSKVGSTTAPRTSEILSNADVDKVEEISVRISEPAPSTLPTFGFDELIITAPKLIGPFKAVARGRTRSEAAKRLQFSFSQPPTVPVTPVDYRVKQSEDEDGGTGIAASAKRGLQAKIDFLSAVQLKKRDVSTGYPDLMLIRIKGNKRPDVRLVAPRSSSLCNYGVYMLVTPKKLFFYHGKFSNLRERTKATIIAKSITIKKGELGCRARQAENVNETKASEFWKLLGCSGPNDITDDEERNKIFEGEEPFESFIAKTNLVFQVCDDHSIKTILSGCRPKCSIMDPKANLIFDFGSEIYVWAGRSANRSGFQKAVDYGKQLQQQGAPHIPDSQVLFGDDFSKKRPNWCLFFKMTQGLADCLFRDKFADWKQTDEDAAFKLRKPTAVKKTEIVTESHEETIAANLAKNLLAFTPTEATLVLEDNEIGRSAENIFTDDLHYYLVEGENKLTELKELTLLFKNACYIIRWDYRIEREGIGKLVGVTDDKDHDTGRQRICYFFWLGSETTNKEQGVCALAVRNFDRERQPHERVVQGQEPFVFFSLFKGRLVTVGYETRIFLAHSSAIMNECYLEELPSPVIFRSHAVYIIATKKITVWYGKESSQRERNCAKFLAVSLNKTNHPYLDCVDKNLDIDEVEEASSLCDISVIRAKNWQKAPRVIRLVENEGSHLSCAQWDPTAPFSFRQHELRDTMIIDQGSGIWLWTDDIPSTQHLRVASLYSKGVSGFATVICKTKEPEEFKALFPTWLDFVDEDITVEDPEKKPPTRSDPIGVDELLKQRNRKFPLEKVRARDLPEGSDLKRLEQYLTDEDFQKVFKMNRGSFYALPAWKQINLRKQNKLF